jgi:Family of unknown function (DUF6186)
MRTPQPPHAVPPRPPTPSRKLMIGTLSTPGLIGWAVVMGILLAYQGLCLVRPNDEWPAFSDLLRAVMRYPTGRWVLFGVWLWSGWHFFVRGWRFFLRA